jgi:heat shock protein HtpX
MGVALAGVALIYLCLLALALALLAAAIADGDAGAVFGWVFLAACCGVVLVLHFGKVEGLTLRIARAKILSPEEEPELHALSARVAAAADVPPPRLALVRSWAPNAFAVGIKPERTVVALTTELRRRLDEGELEAVLAHELAHVANRDGMVMTFVSGPALVGSALWNAEDWQAKILFLYYVPVFLVGLLLLWTISRYREYAADRGACLITGAPEQLQSALAKIAGAHPRGDLRGGAAVSALCIVPAQRRFRWFEFYRRFEMFMDHPSIEKRLRCLAEIAAELGGPER